MLLWPRSLITPACISVLLTLAAPVSAKPPEDYLSDDCVVYARFDGLDPHRQAFDKTTLGTLLQEDLRPLAEHLMELAVDAMGPDVVAERLLEGAEPDQLIRLQKSTAQIPVLIELLRKQGFVLGVEPRGLPAPGAVATIVFPQGGKPENRKAFAAGIELLAMFAKSEVVEVRLHERTIQQVDLENDVVLSGWAEGDSFLCVIGNPPLDKTFALTRVGESIAANPLLEQVGGFSEYETWARGFVDVQRGLKFLANNVPPAGPIVEQLGLNGLTNLTFQAGFEGKNQRTTVALKTTGERTGVLRALATTANLQVEQFPSLPPSSSTVQAAGFQWADLFDAVFETTKTILAATDPDGLRDFDKQWKKFQRELGFDLRDELQQTLDSTVVAYGAGTEGAMFFGMGVAAKVKDEGRARKLLEKVSATIIASSGGELSVRETTYRGATLHIYQTEQSNVFPFFPAAAVHDGWLVVGFSPQVVQGFVLRSTGNYQTWKPSSTLTQALQDAKQRNKQPAAKTFLIYELDPRPTIEQLISISSFITAIASQTREERIDFDMSLIPNSQAVTEWLTPNVLIATDDGRTIRIDGHASLPIPFDLSGYSSLLYVSFAPFIFQQ